MSNIINIRTRTTPSISINTDKRVAPVIEGVSFEVIGGHILNIKGKISVSDDGIVCL